MPAPVLETDRLILRPFLAEDAGDLHAILSDAATMSFWPTPFNAQNTQDWLQRSLASYAESGFGRYAVILKQKNKLIGDCGLLRSMLTDSMADPEYVNDLGYIIHAPEWGHGYGTEAAQAVRNFAFQSLQLESIHANMPFNHHASKRVAESVSMQFIREFNNTKNRNIRTLLYHLSIQEFKALAV